MMPLSTDAIYTKIVVLSSNNIQENMKFFNNPLFCAKLQQYFLRTYDVKCSMTSERLEINLTFTGIKGQVKASRNDLRSLFESTRSKTYNDDVTDRRSTFIHINYLPIIFSLFQLFIGHKIFLPMRQSL